MKRSAATLILVLIGYSLIAPVVFADSGPAVPPCCRKSGKHHCAMKIAGDQNDSSAPAVKNDRTTCPLYPRAGVTPASGKMVAARVAFLFFASVVSHPTAHPQAEALYRILFNRACPKRGPPALQS